MGSDSSGHASAGDSSAHDADADANGSQHGCAFSGQAALFKWSNCTNPSSPCPRRNGSARRCTSYNPSIGSSHVAAAGHSSQAGYALSFPDAFTYFDAGTLTAFGKVAC